MPGSEEQNRPELWLHHREGYRLHQRTVSVQYQYMNGPEQLKSVLLCFWSRFGSRNKHGLGFSKQDKLAALIAHSNLVVQYHRQQSLGERRTKFDQAKQKLHPWRRFGKCFACGSPADERHHIIQLQNGGNNGRKNLVSLCDRCHAEVHPWMKF